MIGQGTESTNQRRHRYVEEETPVGFFTDPTLCIGCKACEVACKEWNNVPSDKVAWTGRSYDNTNSLGASTWRHVLFLEEPKRRGPQIAGPMSLKGEDPFRWVFLSDVCKHCEVAGCLESCPTGAIVRTETEAVFVQNDVCNGCGYCVVSCPFGVIDRRDSETPDQGGAFKCTFCYDRQISGHTPACAKVCPTESIRFGPLTQMREEASRRAIDLKAQGYDDAEIYDPTDTSVKGIHALFLLLGKPEDYRLPPSPEAPTIYLKASYASMVATAGFAGALVFALFLLF